MLPAIKNEEASEACACEGVSEVASIEGLDSSSTILPAIRFHINGR